MKVLISILLIGMLSYSGGDNNLHKRWRPSYGVDKPTLQYNQIDERTRWFVEDVREWLSCPNDKIEMYLYGSRSKNSYWFSSDFDIGITQDVTPQIRQVLENCKSKFKIPPIVKIEINRVYPETDKRMVKVENTTY